MKAGFVNIFGKPNAGKSTLLNALMGEKLAIVSPKVQTTRHRIKGILSTEDYQIIFSDTPGIIDPKYKLHEKMMQAVKGALEDADVALLITDIREDQQEINQLFLYCKSYLWRNKEISIYFYMENTLENAYGPVDRSHGPSPWFTVDQI